MFDQETMDALRAQAQEIRDSKTPEELAEFEAQERMFTQVLDIVLQMSRRGRMSTLFTLDLIIDALPEDAEGIAEFRATLAEKLNGTAAGEEEFVPLDTTN